MKRRTEIVSHHILNTCVLENTVRVRMSHYLLYVDVLNRTMAAKRKRGSLDVMRAVWRRCQHAAKHFSPTWRDREALQILRFWSEWRPVTRLILPVWIHANLSLLDRRHCNIAGYSVKCCSRQPSLRHFARISAKKDFCATMQCWTWPIDNSTDSILLSVLALFESK